MHDLLRVILVVWVVGYLVISCGPLALAATGDAPTALIGIVASLILGSALLGPWIVGLVILGILVVLTRPAGVPPRVRVGPIARPVQEVEGLPAGAKTESARSATPASGGDWQLIVGVGLVIVGVLVLGAVVVGALR